MVNQLVKYFYTQILFKIDEIPQEIVFLLEIPATFFNKLGTDVWEFMDIRGVPGSHKAANWNQPTGKSEAYFLVWNSAVKT